MCVGISWSFDNMLYTKSIKVMRAEEVAYCLLDIFIIFYALNVLQSDNGCEFWNQTID